MKTEGSGAENSLQIEALKSLEGVRLYAIRSDVVLRKRLAELLDVPSSVVVKILDTHVVSDYKNLTEWKEAEKSLDLKDLLTKLLKNYGTVVAMKKRGTYDDKDMGISGIGSQSVKAMTKLVEAFGLDALAVSPAEAWKKAHLSQTTS